MIKSFKDFDEELNGQKIYEAVDDINSENNINTDDLIKDMIPEMVSDDKFLSKIAIIVLKKLNASGLGEFHVYPAIVNIDNVPGVYFYKYDDPTMNIVICRNTNNKYAYYFKKFNWGSKNVADLVLSTMKFGFSEIIQKLISYIKPNAIEEGLICEWQEGTTYTYDENYVEKAQKLKTTTKESILDVIKLRQPNGKFYSYKSVCDTIWNNSDVKSDIEKIFNKKVTPTGYFKNVISLFFNAYHCITKQESVINVLYGTKDYNTIKSKFKNNNPKSGDDGFGDDGSGNGGYDNDESDDDGTGNGGIITIKNVTINIGNGGIKYTDERLREIEKDLEDYENSMDDIEEIANVMCQYVRNNGDLTRDEKSILTKRGMIITGDAGTGKTQVLEKVIKEMNKDLVKDKDYYWVTSGNTNAASLYKKLYNYNGKLIIFDDTGDLFSGDYKGSLWKNAFKSTLRPGEIELNKENGGDRMYDPTDMTRRERYFNEVGHVGVDDELNFKLPLQKKLEQSQLMANGGKRLTSEDRVDIRKEVDKAWKNELSKREPKMPNRFIYNGLVIIISNLDRKTISKSIGEQNWKAIVRRMHSFEINPCTIAIWSRIKTIMLNDQKNNTPDELCLIPQNDINDVIEEVEKNLSDPEYQYITFGTIIDIQTALQGPSGRSKWKEKLKRLMKNE